MKHVSVLGVVVAIGALTASSVRAQTPQAPQTPQTPQAAQGMILEQVLVKVNGEIFTKTQLEHEQIQAIQEQQQDSAHPLTTKDLQNDATLRAALDKITPDLLVNAVNDLLLLQKGKELGFHATDDMFKKWLDQTKKDNNLTTDEQFEAALKQQGLTITALRDEFDHKAVIEQLEQQEVMPKITLTDAETREYFKAHPDEFMKPATATIREILIAVPADQQPGSAADDAALKKAQEIRSRALSGQPFADLAKQNSDSASKDDGGLVAALKLSDLPTELRDVIGKMKVNDISEPFRMQRGYEIFDLVSTAPATLLPFDQVHDQITNKISSQRADVEMRKYVDKLRAEAIIEWKNDDYRKMYEARLAEEAAGK